MALQEFTHAHHEKLVAMTRAKIAKRNKMSRSNALAQYLVLGSSTLKIVPSSEELTATDPGWTWTISGTIGRPRPRRGSRLD